MKRARFLAPWLISCVIVLALMAYPSLFSATSSSNLDMVRAAWQRARQSGAYHFSADIGQTLIPQPTVLNVGRTSKQDALHLEGDVNLPDGQLHFTFWSQGGSVLNLASGVEVQVDGDHAQARQGTQNWQEINNFTGAFAPQGDFMAFLAAARDVKRQDASAPSASGSSSREHILRFTFVVNGPGYAAYVRDQMEQTLAEKGQLPVGVSLDLPQTYMDMTGTGELWIGADGLPRRQIMHLQFPPRADGQRIAADVTVDFSNFHTTPGQAALGTLSSWLLSSQVVAQAMRTSALSLLLLGAVVLLIMGSRSKKVYVAVVVTLIASMVVSPLLQSVKAAEFADQQAAKAQAADERDQGSEMQQALTKFMTESDHDPNVSPLDAARNAQPPISNLRSPVTSHQLPVTDFQSPVTNLTSSSSSSSSSSDAECDANDSGDEDGDGVTNGEECLVGTDPKNSDTDGDGLSDKDEVNGFSFGGQMWYTDATELDTNKDGLGDGQEWDANDDGQIDDTDADGAPDLFDRDNDNDGVPDNLDISPYYKGDTTFTSDQPWSLVVDDLTEGKPTFVEFQLRPTNPDHLWYAFNVLDWPKDDKQGQMQDADGKTFYDVDTSTARSPNDNGDVKLVPMLEIKISQPPFNLPSQEDMDHYGISVMDLDDEGNSKAVYVPLQLVAETQGEAHVAFAGRMLYQPEEQWGEAQQVRMVWAVQALVDVCDQYENNACTHYSQYNDLRVMHTYDDDWQLTGLKVREEHGTDYAAIYEDPDIDNDLNDDSVLTRLAYGLEQTFLAGRDCEQWDDKGTDDPADDVCLQTNGELDVTIGEIYRRFNHADSTANVTETWHISQTLSVITYTYPTADQAVMTLVVTDSKKLLDDHFTAHWSAGAPISPTLLYARMEDFRSLNLGDSSAYTGTVNWSQGGYQLTMDLKPDDVKVQSLAGLNWAPYQYKNDKWQAYPLEQYWDVLKDRYTRAFSQEYSDEENPDELRGGAVIMGQLYYLSLYSGVGNVVQIGPDILSAKYQSSDRPLGATIAKGTGLAVLWVVNRLLVLNNPFFSRTQFLRTLYQLMSKEKYFGSHAGGLKTLTQIPKNIKSLFIRVRSWGWAKGLSAGLLGAILLAGAVIAVVYLVKYYMAGNKTARGFAAALMGGLLLYITVIKPILQIINISSALMKTLNLTRTVAITRVLGSSSEFIGAMKRVALLGLILSIGVAWGVFIWAVSTGKATPGSVSFDLLLAQTIAACILAVVLFVVSLTIIGTIIVSILTIIDVCLMVAGAKWTITGVITDALTKYFFSYEVAIDVKRDDLVKMSPLDIKLIHPEDGAVAGLQLEFATIITNTIVHKDPRDIRTILYLWKYDERQLRSTSFEYRLAPTGKTMNVHLWDTNRVNSWDVSYDHTYKSHDMYRGWIDDDVSAVTRFDEPGINRSAALILSTGYALPGVECWTIPVLGFLAFPPIIICVNKAIEGSTTTDIGAHVVMDVFPRTLNEFVQTSNWASSILFKDKDGDGLIAKSYGGNDPDDTKWDTDGDGLSDGWELQMSSRRADQGGSFYDPLKADTDGDGLSDYDEMIWGTNPNGADTDGDSISDPSEVQGWLFHYITPAGAEKVTRIYTDPLNGDIDNDGMDDLFERTLNTSCDNESDATQRRQCYRDNPYNPNVWNTNPIGVFTEVGDPDSVVRPGQTFVYSTTVQNSVKAGTSLWVRGNTQLTLDSIGGYPLGMTYDIPKDKSQSLYSDLTVNTGVGNKQVDLTTDVHSQLHTPSDWGWDALQINSKTLSGTIPLALSALPVKGWGTAYAALGLDAQGVRVYTATAEGLAGDGVLLFGGGTLEATDLPSMACNNSGTCLAVGAFRDVNTDEYSFLWRTVSPTAASLGTLHTLAVPGLTEDGVASDGSDFLVTWSQGPASNKQLNVLRVLADGNQNGSAFTVDTHTGLDDPDLAFIGNQYQEVWNRNGDIYTAYITGTTVSKLMAVSATNAVEDSPRIGYDPLSDKSLVVYQRANANLRGRIVDAAGASDEINLASINSSQWYHAVQSDPVNGGWVVAWGQVNQPTVYYQGVGMDGGLRGNRQDVKPGGNNQTIDLAASRPRLSLQLHFDEGSGSTTFADSSGFNHDGTCSGSSCPLSGQAGKLGYDVKFDGSNDEVRTLNVSPSNIAYGVTFWFRTDNCPKDHQGKVVCGLYSVDNGESMDVNDDSSAYQRKAYHDRDIYLKSGNVCARLGRYGGEVICTSGKNYGDNQWHFVAHTFGSGVDGQQLYVDGELRASGSRASSDLPGTLMVRIGRTPMAQAYFPYQNTIRSEKRPYFKGDIDEVTVYPHALSAREIKDAMRSPLAVYPFDETGGASTFNQAVNNGNSAGKCSGAACPAAGVTGMAYNAVKFDGSSDVITAANLSLVNSSFTVAFWAKREWINRNEYFVSQGVNQPNKDLFIGFWSSNQFICAFDDDGSNQLVTTGVYTDTANWHHWACTYDATTRQRAIYYDGSLVITDTATANYQGSGSLLIGKARWGNYLRGWVDELGVWGEALSASDIKTLYQKVKAMDDSVTEVLVPRTRKSSGDVYLSRTALHETTTALGKSEQQVKDSLTIDAQLPTSKITSLTNNQHLGVTGTLIIGGEARDNTFVTQVEVRVDSGAWQQAEGAESWSYEWDTSALSEGSHTLSCRATDAGGNVQNPASITVVIDRTPPVITEVNPPQRAYLNSQSQWVVPFNYGQIDDETAGSLEALLEGGNPGVSGYGWQSVQFSGSPRTYWSLHYALPALDDQSKAIANPTGVYTLNMRATDNVGNQRPAAVYSVFQLDNSAPIADVRYTGPSTTVITSTAIVLTGVITDPGPAASGINALQVSFAPIEQRDAQTDAALWLRFDDLPGNQIFVDSARHNNASCQADACPAIGADGPWEGPWQRRAVFFDGANDVVQVPASNNLRLDEGSPEGAFTLSAWVEPELNNVGTYGLMGYQLPDGRYYPSLWLVKLGPYEHEVRAGFTDTEGVFHQLQTAGINNYDWNHIVVTFDGTTMRLYTHGQQQGNTSAFANTRPITDAMQIDVGHVDSYFRGRIYDAAIYQRALEPDEVTALYNTGQVLYKTATLAQAGAGVITTTWTLTVPADLEDFYAIRLRGQDMADNRNNDPSTWTGWEGMIDTKDPRNNPHVTWQGSTFVRTSDVVCDVSDLNLDEDNFSGCPIPKSAWQRTYYDEVSPWYARVITDTERLYRIFASQHFNSLIPAVSNTVCDTPGHCTTTTYPSTSSMQAPDSVQDVLVDSTVMTPTNGVMLSTTAPFTVQGVAQAVGYLEALTVTANSLRFYVAGWPMPPAPGAVTQTTWSTLFTPTLEGRYTFLSTAGDWLSNVQTTTYPITVTVDLLPPAPPIFDPPVGTTGVITTAHRVYQGATALTGIATDTIGVERVQLNIDNLGWYNASLDGSAWRYLWRIGDTDPDGATYTVTARATDLAGHTTAATTTLLVDMQPPAPVTMTLAYRDSFNVYHPIEPQQTITNGNALIVEWTPGSDGSGLTGYWVGWNTSPTSTQGTTFIPAGTIYSYTQIISEAQAVYAHIVTVDLYGNRSERVSDPVYVDSPLTPDIVEPIGSYQGWMDNGCTGLGVNRRVEDHALSGASLSEAQKFYATWNADALRLAWDGATWDAEGDLFVYLDYQPGGATQLYNPYSATISNTTIYLPGDLPPSPSGAPPEFESVRQSMLITPLLGVQMQADSLVWVKDADTAVLMTWDGLNWTTSLTLTASEYQLNNGLTDLYLPFSLLGISNPTITSLTLLAAASQEDALRLWAVMPERNPLNGAQVIEPLAAVATPQVFPLASAYYWPSLGPGLCPASISNPQSPILNDSNLRASISAEPLGTTYSLMGDDLFWQWQTLFQGSGPKSQQFDFLDHNHPQLSDGQVITYALHIANRGTSTATGVKALMSAYYALSLANGTSDTTGYRDYQIVDVGDVAPGTTVTRTFTGTVMVNTNWRYAQCLSSLPPEACEPLRNWSLLDGLIFDSYTPLTPTIGIPTRPSLEWVWADHAVDTQAPQFVGISAPQFAVRPGANVIQGYASDPSGVPLIEVQVRDPLSVTTTLTCPDASPYDGRWTCDWNVAGNDGDEFSIRAQATDRFGHVSAWTSPWRNLIVDSVPPTITLDADAFDAVNGQIIGPAGALLTGSLGDNHSGGQALVCDGASCVEATTLMAAQVPTTTALLYDDVPTPTISITTTTFCGGGEITRTFDVPDSFIVGDVGVGFNALHPNREEIVVDLVSPAGTRARLIEPSGTMYGFANYDVWLSDAATQPLHVAIDDDVDEPYFDRAAQPDSPLSVFNGEAANGVWQMRICDLNPLTEGGAYNRSRLSLSPQGAALSTTGTWAYALPTFVNADGLTQTLSIYGLDGVGNRTADTISLTYQLDVVPPALTVTVVMTQTSQVSPTIVLAGQVTDGGGLNGVYVRVDPPEGASYRDGVDLVGMDWTYTPRPTVPGAYTFRLEAYDLAGNVSTRGPYEVQVGMMNYMYLPVVMNKWSGEFGANLVYLPLIVR